MMKSSYGSPQMALTLATRAIDLRFASKEAERAYVASVEHDLLRLMLCATLLEVVVVAPIPVALYVSEASNDERPFGWDLGDPRTAAFTAYWLVSFLSAVLGGLIALRLWAGMFKAWPWESLSMGLLVLGSIAVNVFNATNLSVIYGVSSMGTTFENHESEKTIDLISILLLMAVSLLTPIRTCVSWVLPLSMVLIRTWALAARGVVNVFTVPSYFLFVASASLAHFGAWRHELNNRQKHTALNVQHQLEMEQEAVSSLLAMLTEGAIWLAPDGDTIKRSHAWLDMAVRRSMLNKAFSDILCPRDVTRMRTCLRTMEGTELFGDEPPVLCLAVTLMSFLGDSLEVDMFIVNRRRSSNPSGSAQADSGFLIGLRSKGQVEESHSCHLDQLHQLPDGLQGLAPVLDPSAFDMDSVSAAGNDNLLVLAGLSPSKVVVPASSRILLAASSNKFRSVPVSSLQPGDRVHHVSCDVRCPLSGSSVVLRTEVDLRLPCRSIGCRVDEVDEAKRCSFAIPVATSFLASNARRSVCWVAASTLRQDDLGRGLIASTVDPATADAGCSAARVLLVSATCDEEPN
eukprot:TRINITY_DN22325_c0_g1_i2.p1 TRINITY_DN22325_c0_g1~~TRINITY_DN22325_c0_g1_i2.p1  ORF type:complete len:574 (-),score=45.44 TRINITY_DN22325_c0_g1_i2:502-2223(-)